jgi:hypothetical protein
MPPPRRAAHAPDATPPASLDGEVTIAFRNFETLSIRDGIARDADSSYLELDPDAGSSMDDLLGHSITYRVAVGPRAGQNVFSLQTLPARGDEPRQGVARYAGFSLHATGGRAAVAS